MTAVPQAGALARKTVLVTGGSRGIGAATARALHREGASVVVHFGSDRAAASGLADQLGDRVFLVQGDLLTPGAAAEVWSHAVDATGQVDVLVNNAGAWIASPVADAEGWARGWQQNLTLNLVSAADLCRQALLHFLSRGGGTIVNVSSRSAHRGDDADHLAYGAAKGGLLALTRGIARGYGARNVLAYAVAPGWVATDLAADALEGMDLAGMPLGEPTPPQDVAETIAFLASGRARHVTGATIDITGADYVR
jgi:NAD(P)-dependent dehydrogenase (short-subunit alcohol dehydrogenase family)